MEVGKSDEVRKHHPIMASWHPYHPAQKEGSKKQSSMVHDGGIIGSAKISSEERNGDYKNSINFYKFLVREETVSVFHHFNTFCRRPDFGCCCAMKEKRASGAERSELNSNCRRFVRRLFLNFYCVWQL